MFPRLVCPQLKTSGQLWYLVALTNRYFHTIVGAIKAVDLKLTDFTKVVPFFGHRTFKMWKNVERPFSASFKYFLMKFSGSPGMNMKRSNPGCFC